MNEDILKDQTANPRQFGEMPEQNAEVNEAGEEIPTEEEQLNYDMLVVRARKMMYGPGKNDILEMMGASERPSRGMGQAASMLVKSLVNSAKEGGREIDANTALEAGAEIIEDLSALGKSKGVFQYESPEEEKSEMEDAMLWGVKFYGDGMVQSGEITPEIQNLAKQEVQQGLQEEQGNQAMQMNPAAAGVKQAMGGGGVVNNAMGNNNAGNY